VEKYRARAEALADEVEPAELRELLYYLVDSVLEKAPVPEDGPKEFAVELGLPK
jgi:geranylgeranyl diphosphate synthase type II